MSKTLPSGYTQVEYIQSSGTQYIDTGFKPNQDTRVVMYGYNESSNSAWIYGAWNSANSGAFAYLSVNRYYMYGSQQINANSISTGEFTLDHNKNSFTLNGTTISGDSETFTCNYSLYLFALNVGGSVSSGKLTGKLYSCQIYDNGTLVRDYVPCKNPDGIIGLYDLVNDTFYVNAGTGEFIAGAEKTTIPTTPENIKANITEGILNLTWDEISSATGYKVEKYGYFQTQTETNIYTESIEPYTFFTYLVSAFNENGQSEYASIEVYYSNDNVVLDLITDRTQADVSRAKTLASKIWTKMTDEEKSEFLSNMKGAYNASDFNRVEEAVSYIANRLIKAGYEPYGTLGEKVYRKTGDIPIPSQIETYLDKVGIIKNSMPNFSTTPNMPIFKGKTFTYEEANDIEKILIDIDKVITLAEYVPYYSGDIFAGEV